MFLFMCVWGREGGGGGSVTINHHVRESGHNDNNITSFMRIVGIGLGLCQKPDIGAAIMMTYGQMPRYINCCTSWQS